jgi:retron-type reverse transcriptase
MEEGNVRHEATGTPQGGVISPLLTASKQFNTIDHYVWRRITRKLGKQRGLRGHRLAWRVAQQRRAWPMAKLRARGLHKLLGTIQYPGSKTA